MKSSNKAGQSAAEGMEGRGLTKGNPQQQNASRTQSRTDAPSALERIRQAASKDKEMQFTALSHHIYALEALRTAYLYLKREAAPGVDGETCKAGSYGKGRLFPSERGTPQGGVASPLLSNILLTPFDREMRHKGYQLTRYADDWVVTCKSAAEARAAINAAGRILKQLGVELHPQKTRIVPVQYGFEFLGYKIKRGKKLYLPATKIRRRARSGALYAYPREKSIRCFKDEVRQRRKRRVPGD